MDDLPQPGGMVVLPLIVIQDLMRRSLTGALATDPVIPERRRTRRRSPRPRLARARARLALATTGRAS